MTQEFRAIRDIRKYHFSVLNLVVLTLNSRIPCRNFIGQEGGGVPAADHYEILIRYVDI